MDCPAERFQTTDDGLFDFKELIDESERVFGVGAGGQAGFVGGGGEAVSGFRDALDGGPPAGGLIGVCFEEGVGLGAGRFLEIAGFVGGPRVEKPGDAVFVRRFDAATAGDFVRVVTVVFYFV
jgi:hypothetical protein